MEQTVLQRPEILAPAGNADMLRAAVFAGADAVYLGLDGYNAGRRIISTITVPMPCAKPSVFVMPAGLRCM